MLTEIRGKLRLSTSNLFPYVDCMLLENPTCFGHMRPSSGVYYIKGNLIYIHKNKSFKIS
jgi:hypothetical protein